MRYSVSDAVQERQRVAGNLTPLKVQAKAWVRREWDEFAGVSGISEQEARSSFRVSDLLAPVKGVAHRTTLGEVINVPKFPFRAGKAQTMSLLREAAEAQGDHAPKWFVLVIGRSNLEYCYPGYGLQFLEKTEATRCAWKSFLPNACVMCIVCVSTINDARCGFPGHT